MPFLRIQTNHPLTEADARSLAGASSALVAEQLGKPERYVMTSVETNPSMQFAGSDAPLAYLELKSIGLPESITGIASERIYIEFADAPRKMWGWNGGTF